MQIERLRTGDKLRFSKWRRGPDLATPSGPALWQGCSLFLAEFERDIRVSASKLASLRRTEKVDSRRSNLLFVALQAAIRRSSSCATQLICQLLGITATCGFSPVWLEDHGWDGLFIWDQILAPGAMPVADSMVTLTAIALELD